jgi:steroid delta-isomerase-like uncharacterized protein
MNEHNKALVITLFEEAWNRGNLDHLDEVYSPDFVLHALWHDPALGGCADAHGVDAAKAAIGDWQRGFPDLHVTIEDTVAMGDRVACRHTSTGTHADVFQGIPATGVTATITGMTIARIADDRIVEAWTAWDALGAMQALGVVPNLAAQRQER